MKIPLDSILCGDCLELIRDIPDGVVDAVITDPPYGCTDCKWDIVPDLEEMWRQLWRVLKPNGTIAMFCTAKFGIDLVGALPSKNMFKYDLIWEKQRAVGFLSANRLPLRAHESIYIFNRGGAVYNPQKTQGKPYTRPAQKKGYEGYHGKKGGFLINADGMRYPTSVFKIDKIVSRSRHPTEKPVELVEWLLRTYSMEGDLILDPFAGSGTLAIAALRSKRHYICMEWQEEYCKKMTERVAQYTGIYNIDIENYKKTEMLFNNKAA